MTVTQETTSESLSDSVSELTSRDVSGSRVPIFAYVALALNVALAFFYLLPGAQGSAVFEFFNNYLYSIAALAGTLVLVVAAALQTGKHRRGWLLIGLGGTSFALGEALWSSYNIRGVEVPYPGAPDVLYLLGYPLIFAGVLLLPHVKGMASERLRISLDGVVGMVSVALIAWYLYLGDIVASWAVGSTAEVFIGAAYPLADLFLLSAAIVLAVRPGRTQLDWRLVVLAVVMVLNAIVDTAYLLQIEAGTYIDGNNLNSGWLLSYGGFALLAILLPRVPDLESKVANQRWVNLVVPYAAALSLLGFQLSSISRTTLETSDRVIQYGSLLVAVLIIVRQSAAIRENRLIVEKQRTDLVASISHELRTPLTAMQGFTAILEDAWQSMESADVDEMLMMVNGQTNHLGRIVTDLIEVSRDNLSTSKLHLEKRNLTELVHSSTAMAATADEISVVGDDGIVLYADPARVKQIIVNMLSNADRYGNGRTEIVYLRRPGRVEIEVHDNGRGVSRKYEDAIWDRFERGENRLNAVTPGSGLGLAIAKALAEAHGGGMTYRTSERLGGACFVLALPQN